MSRHTRWLRKQAKAKAAEQPQNAGFSGGTALLDRPRAPRLSPDDDLNLGEPAPQEAWTDTDSPQSPAAEVGPAREAHPRRPAEIATAEIAT
ncbi:MAG: hypothetical protein ACK5TO_06460, partial [Planctomycetaceae bacterium]